MYLQIALIGLHLYCLYVVDSILLRHAMPSFHHAMLDASQVPYRRR